MAFQTRTRGIGPHAQFGLRRGAQFLSKGLSDVGYRLRAFLNLEKARGPVASAGGNRFEQSCQRIERVGQLLARYDMRALGIGDLFQRFAQKLKRISDSRKWA